ncbi:D-alanyl-D-alanine carboxypeptidase [Candidatus Peregrinibacteria bacterium]|nr:D-alanyl-D-alanine carboxypeptidase [Candidatus Peregrinibacteria bacterium]MBI3816030.1 D-alanyl-D-alanine carboxypeptidase [Candidatus Peregrinibacteria bacterium]
MYAAVLSVLLMGLIPVRSDPATSPNALAHLSVAPPSPSGEALAQSLILQGAVSASGIVIVDLQSSQILLAKNGTIRRPIASLAKLMTALLIAEHHGMNEWVRIPDAIAGTEGHVVHLPPGEQFRVGDLLEALLVSSADDAAVALAMYHSGSLDAFVSQMNERASLLGLTNTSFANPIGLDDLAQWSTPQDIAWLTMFVFRRPELRSRLSFRKKTTITSRSGTALPLEQTHALLHGDSPVIAGKTGTTDDAKECLMSIVREHERNYVVVLLGSRQRYADMRVVLFALASLFP